VLTGGFEDEVRLDGISHELTVRFPVRAIRLTVVIKLPEEDAIGFVVDVEGDSDDFVLIVVFVES